MHLQQLEIFGFKSFPERSELIFDHGVTAIVGPNGCGKSNLIDAITWVLGEQSAKSLRGDRMEDVIFSGSDARKPTAAAEVRLYLAQVNSSILGSSSNDQDNEIGNGNNNGRSPYSTSSDKSDKSSLDTSLSDTRNVEVLRRLYRSGESEYLIDGEVCRLRDIQDLMMDAGVGIKAYAVIEQGKIGQILSSRPTERRQLLEEAAGVTKYKTRRRAAELKLEAAQQNLTRIDDIVFEIDKQRNSLRRQAAKARRYRRLRDDLRRWEKAIFTTRYRGLNEVIDIARGRLAEAKTREQTILKALADRDSHYEGLRSRMIDLEAQVVASREAAHAKELEIGQRKQQIEFETQQIASLSSATVDLQAELDALSLRRTPAKVDLEKQREAAEDCDRERNHAEQLLREEELGQRNSYRTIEELEAKIDTARSEVFDAVNAVTAAVARLKSLEQLEASRAAYDNAERLVLSELGGSINHLGSVADYLEVDKKFELAVEACLGDLLQCVVVERYEHAVEAIQLVREQNAGRCSFFVLEGKGNVRTQLDSGEIDPVPLSTVIRISGPYASVISEAIGQAWIADSFEQAKKWSRVLQGPVATLDGEVFRSSLLVQGGTKNSVRGILSIKREVKELRESIEKLETNRRVADDSLTIIQRRLFDARELIELQSHKTSEAKARLAKLEERSTSLSSEVRRLVEKHDELESRIESRNTDLSRISLQNDQLKTSMQESERLLEVAVKDFSTSQSESQSSNEHLSEIRSNIDTQEASVRETRQTLEDQRAIVFKLDINRATAEADLANLTNSCVDSFQMSPEQVIEQVDQFERNGELNVPVNVIDRDSEDVDIGESAIESSESLDLTKNELSESADASELTLSEETITAEKCVETLREKIERLGPVNMMAIDQFDELEARYTFLTTQRKDLIDSILATGEAIKKIDKTTRERFNDAFLAINKNFQDTFSILFGGGQAGLILLDENDPLESGIDIIAQPPGKRLQNIQLLSGGEKALSALALMFAIFKYKPSPFCLLDEIDAPLDDANIGRFLEMLRGMQAHTQFILVTHNRKTMEIADRLCGVTMEEPGVSKLISVQLDQA